MNSLTIRGIRSPIRSTVKRPTASPLDFAMGLSGVQAITKELADLKKKYEDDHQALMSDVQQDHDARMAQLDTHLERLAQITPDSLAEMLLPYVPEAIPGKDAPVVDEAKMIQRV